MGQENVRHKDENLAKELGLDLLDPKVQDPNPDPDHVPNPNPNPNPNWPRFTWSQRKGKVEAPVEPNNNPNPN